MVYKCAKSPNEQIQMSFLSKSPKQLIIIVAHVMHALKRMLLLLL